MKKLIDLLKRFWLSFDDEKNMSPDEREEHRRDKWPL
jgi:hypothetical protein